MLFLFMKYFFQHRNIIFSYYEILYSQYKKQTYKQGL